MGARHILMAVALTGAAGAAAAEPSRDSEANMAFVNYPRESLEKGEQGTVAYRVLISGNGRVKDCEVTRSSGYSRLDQATCMLLLENARFTPARNRHGRSHGSRYEGRVTWRLS